MSRSGGKKSTQDQSGLETPAGRFLSKALSGESDHLVSGYHPDDLLILQDALTYFIFSKFSSGEKPSFAWIARDRGIFIETEDRVDGRIYPYRKVARPEDLAGEQNDALIYVYAKEGLGGQQLEHWAEEKIKLFEEVNIATKAELIRQCVGSYDEEQLIEIARKFDPRGRDLKEFTQRLLERKRKRNSRSDLDKSKDNE